MKLIQFCEAIDGKLEGNQNPELEIKGIGPLEKANSNEISFLSNPRFSKFLENSKAAAILVDAKIKNPSGLSFIRVKNPYLAFALGLKIFNPGVPLHAGIHETAVIEKDADIDSTAEIGPFCYVGKKVRIGPQTKLFSHVAIESETEIGANCKIYNGVLIREKCKIGNAVVLQPGVVIGGDGFGYAPDEKGVYHFIPQIGNVILEDNVEIGSNTTVDRGVMGSTLIQKGTKLDNLVMVAHNVDLGKHTVVAALAGFSGSTTVGKHAIIGGQAGFAGHLKVGDKAVVNAQSGVTQNIPDGEMWSDTPARPFRKMRRLQALWMQIPELFKRVKNLEKNLEKQPNKKTK